MMDREQKLKSLRVRLSGFRERAAALKDESWHRSHSAIISYDRVEGKGYGGCCVALAEADLLKRGHGGFANDVAQESATTRQIVGACPKAVADLIDRLYDLYPELRNDS